MPTDTEFIHHPQPAVLSHADEERKHGWRYKAREIAHQHVLNSNLDPPNMSCHVPLTSFNGFKILRAVVTKYGVSQNSEDERTDKKKPHDIGHIWEDSIM